MLESVKAAQLTDILDMEISTDQVIVAHTPTRALVPQYHDKRVSYVMAYRRADN